MSTKKNKWSIFGTITNLMSVVPALFGFVVSIFKLIGHEMGLMRRNLVIVLICTIFLIVLLGSTWFCLLTMLFAFLASLNFSVISGLTIILLVNLLFLAIVVAVMMRAKANLFFPETSRQISKIGNIF